MIHEHERGKSSIFGIQLLHQSLEKDYECLIIDFISIMIKKNSSFMHFQVTDLEFRH